MDVAIRDLKAKLSAYVKRAAAGELITVTDRGRPVATLGPPAGRVDLDDAASQEWLTRASRTGLEPIRGHQTAATVQQLIDEDRAE